MCGATLVCLLAVAGSNDNLFVALIGLAGAALGSVALVYTSRYKAKHPEEIIRTASDLSIMGTQAYDMSRRMDRSDDRLDRVEKQVDYNTRRLDRILDAAKRGADDPDES